MWIVDSLDSGGGQTQPLQMVWSCGENGRKGDGLCYVSTIRH